jgi:hypothetical protein
VAERFHKAANVTKFQSRASVTYQRFYSQVSSMNKNASLSDGDNLEWEGVRLKGEFSSDPAWDLELIFEYLYADIGNEGFRVVEVGASYGYRLVDSGRFLLKAYGEFLGVPFATYSVGDDFRKRGYGFSLGTGLNASWKFGENWGVEAMGGVHHLKLLEFEVPEPYQNISPSFTGLRLSLGANYKF